MRKQSFFHSLAPSGRLMVGNLFFMYLIQGIFVILIGSILPMMKEEYSLGYRVGGFLISAHSIGNMITGLVAGLLRQTCGKGKCLWFSERTAFSILHGHYVFLPVRGSLRYGLDCYLLH